MSNADSILGAAESLSKQTIDRGYAIAGDEDLTPQARAERIDALWTEAEAKMEQYRTDYHHAVEADDRQAEKALFKPPSTDPARLASYRSALDRANAAQERDGLESLLEEAELIGDEDQALAAYTVGIRNGNTRVVHSYLADRPSRQTAYQAYAERHSGNVMGRKIAAGMRLSLPSRPAPGAKQMFFG